MTDVLWKRLKSLAVHVQGTEAEEDVRRLRNLAATGVLDEIDREVALETLDEYGY